MPVSTLHPEYAKVRGRIELTEDAVSGDVKSERYVPRLTAQSQAAWETYVGRAAYYNVTERSLIAMIGALMRKPFSHQGLSADPHTDNSTFAEFLQQAYRALLTQGRVGIHVDFDDAAGSPKLIAYEAENIINWSDRFIVIEECVHEVDPDDEFVIKTVTQYRELRLNAADQYEVRLWRQKGRGEFVVIDTQLPTVRGQTLTSIPFWFVTPYDNSTTMYSPPLSALAELNVQHFRLSVDHNHGLHYLALPQPWIAGDLYTENGQLPKTLAIGTDQVWHLTPGSTTGFLEFSGAGLQAITAELSHLEEQMYSAGSRLLTVKRGVESAEALQLRAGSESATLVTIALALEQALTAALTVYNQWSGSSATPSIELNKDFTAAVIDPAELKVLLEAYTKGALSLDSLLKRLYDGEIVADIELEKTALKNTRESASTSSPQ